MEPNLQRTESHSTPDKPLQYPILRTRKGLIRSQAIAVYKDHLLSGFRFLRPICITEDMCAISGEAVLKQHLDWSQTIPFEDIAEIREIPSSFVLRTKAGSKFRFTIPASQVPNVQNTFFTMMGDRYFRYSAQGSVGIPIAVTMIIAGILVLLVGLGMVRELPAVGVLYGLMSVTLIGFGVRFLFGNKNKRNSYIKVETPTPAINRFQAQRAKTPSPSRIPLYSPLLGWVLKFLGLLYVIVLLSPTTIELLSSLNKISDNVVVKQNISFLIWLPPTLMIYLGLTCSPETVPQGMLVPACRK